MTSLALARAFSVVTRRVCTTAARRDFSALVSIEDEFPGYAVACNKVEVFDAPSRHIDAGVWITSPGFSIR